MCSAVVDRMTKVNPGSIVIFVFIIVTGMIFSGCNGVTPVVKIGLVGPFEGKHRDVGYDVIYSERLAIREINRSGGIGDYRLALVALDDFGDPDSAKEMAAALATDEAVMVVIGHWLPETSQSAALIYEDRGLPIILAGEFPFGPIDPSSLPSDFIAAYSEITPFDEVAGPYAAAGYDALYLAVSVLDLVQQQDGIISRERVGEVLDGFVYNGITGPVYAP